MRLSLRWRSGFDATFDIGEWSFHSVKALLHERVTGKGSFRTVGWNVHFIPKVWIASILKHGVKKSVAMGLNKQVIVVVQTQMSPSS